MRTVVDREEEAADSEVTLSTATLLGIFFGLVLICGVFFGFGYSIGRRGTPAATTVSATAAPAADAESTAPPIPTKAAPKPSAMETLQAAGTDKSPASDDDSSSTVTQPLQAANTPSGRLSKASPASAPVPVAPPAPRVVRAAAIQPAKPVSIAPASSPTPVSSPASGSIMVQIAAVSHQEDADALIAALRKHGYSVSARNEPQDKLLHVQVGPFPSRDAARAMRSKLAADGYNAILKQ